MDRIFDAYEAVVLAADGACSACSTATDTDDRDRRALKADQDAKVAENNPEKTEERSSVRRGSLNTEFVHENFLVMIAEYEDTHRLDTLAALDGASVALADRRDRRGRRGHGDGFGDDRLSQRDGDRPNTGSCGPTLLGVGGGDRKEGKGKNGKGRDAREHVCCWIW